MLKSLSIVNYALIESLEISFPDGLIIITGETGAGKSILLGAISLLLGGKADKDILKDPEKNCIVEALFEIDITRETEELLLEHSFEPQREFTIRRVISSNGRTRSFFNDEPVTNNFLKDLSEKIIDIHAQHEHLLIGDSSFQLSVLDSFANNGKTLEEYRFSLERFKQKEREIEDLKRKIRRKEEDFEYSNYNFKQLDEAKLIDGELELLEDELKILSNAEEIKNTLISVEQFLNLNGISTVQVVKDCEQLLNKITSNFSPASQLAQRLESCRIELKEVERECVTLAESVNVDNNRLGEVEARLSFIYNLLSKYRVKEVVELIRLKDELSGSLNESDELKEKLDRELSLLEDIRLTTRDWADKLSENRANAVALFSSEIGGKIRELEMPDSCFEVRIIPLPELNINGKERVEFLFSANKNIAARELAKIASGGELSRIMLCLKSIIARGKGMPTLIFDEIDSGVSGSIADKMGSLIQELSINMQLFVITHLPQIASKGECHLLVYKEEDKEGQISTKIKRLEENDRVMEIARMLSGSSMTEAAVNNAKVFLNN